MEFVEMDTIRSSVHQSSRWCFFCFKKCEIAEPSPDKHDQLQQTHLGVLLRYINSVEVKDQLGRLNEFSNEKLSTCQDCSFVLSGLHKSYHEMKCAELRVKWRLETLLRVMTLAERVKLRVREFEDNLRTSSTQDRTDEVKDVYELRRKMKGKGKEKLRLSFPRLALKRCLNEQAKAINMDTVELEIKRLKTESPMSPKREEGEAPPETDMDPDVEFSKVFIAKQTDSEQESEVSSGEIMSSEVDSITSSTPPNEVEAELKPEMESNSEFTGYCKENELCSSSAQNKCASEGENRQIGIEDKSTLTTIKTENPSNESVKGASRKRSKASKARSASRIDRETSKRLLQTALKRSRNSETKQKPANMTSFKVKYDGAFPTLKELALEQIVKQKFSCKVLRCPGRRNRGTFFNRLDYLSHKRLHGEFKCNFCELTKTYAPDLTRHELLNHGKGFKDKLMGCSRCEWKSGWRHLLTHHIKSHLKLTPPTRQTCPICQMSLPPSIARREFLAHYKLHHDLSGVDYSSINKCDVTQNCKAYFRTHDRLRRHKLLRHKWHGNLSVNGMSCRLCKETFATRTKFRNHRLAKHENHSKFKCAVDDCGETFDTMIKAKRHEQNHQGQFRCSKCGETVKKEKYWLHLRLHTKDKKFPIISTLSKCAEQFGLKVMDCEKYFCEKCPQVFFTNRDLETHSKLHGTFHCSFCKKVVTYGPTLLSHELSHLKGKNSCPRCSVRRNEMNDLSDHFMELHLNLKMDWHKCSICDKTFKIASPTRKNTWKIVCGHYSRVHNLSKFKSLDSVYKCEESDCHAYFADRRTCFEHQRSHVLGRHFKVDFTANGSKVFVCNKCGKKIKSASISRMHWKNIHEQREYLKCPHETCSFRAATMAELKTHLETVEVVVCGKCGKSFHGKAGLRSHDLYHKFEGDKAKLESKSRRQCETCGKLVSKYMFSTHVLWHAGPDAWEFECSVCSKKCISEDKLNEHMRTHSGLKPFVCEICGAKYAHRHNLRNHVNSKHGDVTRMEPIPKGPKPNTPSARKGKKYKEKSGTNTGKKRGNAGRNEKAKGKVGLALEVEPGATGCRKSTRVTRKRVDFNTKSSDED